MIRIKSSQKFFTEDEVSSLTGICLRHLDDLIQMKHLGQLVERAGDLVRLFTSSDLIYLTKLYPRCQH
ncbi:MAG TPA: hypothetical protein VIH17_07560 [Candidatus Acidoferrales bacterium]